MKKLFAIVLAAFMATATASACPLWTCNYDYYDYNCGCQCNQQTAYHCETQIQPIYCQYCGYEQWNCQCDQSYTIQCNEDTYYEEQMNEEPECYYDQDISYDTSAECNYSSNYSSCTCMAQWANIRNSCGVIIAQAGAGDLIDICGTEADTGRTLIYDRTIGVYGSVLSECIYGTYTWDGSGDNGVYNQYNGVQTCGSCGYAMNSCVCNQVCAYQPVYCTYTYSTCY